MKQVILNLWQENGTLSTISQMQIMMYVITEVLRSNLYNYNDSYILVKGDISVVGDNGILHQVYYKNLRNNNR